MLICFIIYVIVNFVRNVCLLLLPQQLKCETNSVPKMFDYTTFQPVWPEAVFRLRLNYLVCVFIQNS